MLGRRGHRGDALETASAEPPHPVETQQVPAPLKALGGLHMVFVQEACPWCPTHDNTSGQGRSYFQLWEPGLSNWAL
jgi:hypothetical protein